MIIYIQPKPVITCEQELGNLHKRLQDTRFPGMETAEGWDQGPPLGWMQKLRDYWLDQYDWRQTEAALNEAGSFAAKIGDDEIHFLHIRARQKARRAIVMTHGWPGSILEFLETAKRLTNPCQFGRNQDEAFDVVIPAPPGFGFSSAPKSDWTIQQTAKVWADLMQALGYSEYFAQGGDWGSAITIALAQQDPDHCKAIHLNALWIDPANFVPGELTEDEINDLTKLQSFSSTQTSYAQLQTHKPQKIGYALADSPIALAAWLLDLYWTGVAHDGALETRVSFDKLIDAVMMYWLPNAGASSARFYWKNYTPLDYSRVETPAGFSRFPGEVLSVSRRLTEKRLANLIYWNEPKDGGHFAALEQPDLFADEVFEFARAVEQS